VAGEMNRGLGRADGEVVPKRVQALAIVARGYRPIQAGSDANSPMPHGSLQFNLRS
jgi:hypothetical protein